MKKKAGEERCPYCKNEHLILPNTLWIQCTCGAKWIKNEWLSVLDQFTDVKT